MKPPAEGLAVFCFWIAFSNGLSGFPRTGGTPVPPRCDLCLGVGSVFASLLGEVGRDGAVLEGDEVARRDADVQQPVLAPALGAADEALGGVAAQAHFLDR